MSASERQDYEKRRADELYDNMLSGAQIKKQRMADVFTNYMVGVDIIDGSAALKKMHNLFYRNNGRHLKKPPKSTNKGEEGHP